MIFYSLLFLVASYLLLPTEHVNYSKEKLPEESIILKGKIDSQVYLKDSSLSFILKSATNHVNIRYFYEQDIKEIEKPLENKIGRASCRERMKITMSAGASMSNKTDK